MSYLIRGVISSVALAALMGMSIPAQAHEGMSEQAIADAAQIAPSAKVVATQAVLRDLWIEHVFWVRAVVVATLANNPAAAKAAENEVVTNAKQIAGAIEPFYGKAASDKLFGLLAGHYGSIKLYLEATVAGSTAKQDAAWKKIAANATDIAAFLSAANPNLPVNTVRGLLFAHAGHHLLQIKQLHDKQYTQEAQTWAAMTHHMYAIADALTAAIAKQFPEKFQ
jgi:hypothetical protein